MTVWYLGSAMVLLLTIVVGLIRVLRAPSPADRMIAAQLFGTSGVAWILLLSAFTGNPTTIDVALVMAILAAVTAAFGLVLSLVWLRLQAPDVALAEAAIGAGLTGAFHQETHGHGWKAVYRV